MHDLVTRDAVAQITARIAQAKAAEPTISATAAAKAATAAAKAAPPPADPGVEPVGTFALRDDELMWSETKIRSLPQHAVLWQHRRVLLAWAAAESGGGSGELEPRWLGAEAVERERALAEAIESGDERAVVNARRHAQWCEGYAAKVG